MAAGHWAFLGSSPLPTGLSPLCLCTTDIGPALGGRPGLQEPCHSSSSPLGTPLLAPVCSHCTATNPADCQLCCSLSRPGRVLRFGQMEEHSRGLGDVWHAFIHGWVSHSRCKLRFSPKISLHVSAWHTSWPLLPSVAPSREPLAPLQY